MVKNYPSKLPKWAKFWSKISIFGVIYRPLELKIPPKVGLLRSKTMPKHFLNNSKTTLEKSRKRLFWAQNWSKCPPQRASFWVYFLLQKSINDPKNQDFRSKFCPLWQFWGVIFDNFGGRKSRYLDFFKVVLELFRKCLGIVFGFVGPTFGCIFTFKGW